VHGGGEKYGLSRQQNLRQLSFPVETENQKPQVAVELDGGSYRLVFGDQELKQSLGHRCDADVRGDLVCIEY
jgi:hypothetical protein